MDWLSACKDYGLVGIMIASALILNGFLVRSVWNQFKNELENNRKERTDYLVVLGKLKDGIDEHNIRSREFQCSVTAEHKEMIASLGRINGYKKD